VTYDIVLQWLVPCDAKLDKQIYVRHNSTHIEAMSAIEAIIVVKQMAVAKKVQTNP
jgi:hypothetical protein